jgi:hypothetical protein
MLCVVSIMVAHKTGEDVVASKPPKRVGVITVSIAVTQPVLS